MTAAYHVPDLPEFIVAEVTKSWHANKVPKEPILSQLFEKVIATNWERGYQLYSFTLSSVLGNGVQQETIVAVFRLAPIVPC